MTLIGFFTPIIFFILNIHKQGVDALETQLKERKATMGTFIKLHDPDEETAELIGVVKNFQGQEQTINSKMKLLRPRRQFARLSGSLVGSFIGVEVYLLCARIPTIASHSHWMRPWALILSLILLFYAMFVIWQLISILVDIDSIIRQKNDATNVSSPKSKADNNG